jgi:hypothetical protein
MKIPQKFKNAIDIAIKEMKEELDSWREAGIELIGVHYTINENDGCYIVIAEGFIINEDDEEVLTSLIAREIPA